MTTVQKEIEKAKKLTLEAGFTVYDSGSTYFHYSDGENIGYVEVDELTTCFNLSKPIKPCKHNGNSSSFKRGVVKLTRKLLNDCLISINGDLYRRINHSFGQTETISPKTYKNAEAWLDQYWNRNNLTILKPHVEVKAI